MTKRALFIGRFQPPHLGHLDALRQILEHEQKFDEVIIAIGSAEQSFSLQNPLTCSERLELLAAALDEAQIPHEKIWLLPIRDINRPALWPFHVMELCPEFQAVFSGSAAVRDLWENALGGTGKQVFVLEKRLAISATEVREKVTSGESFEKFVPKAVQILLENWNVRKRLEELPL